MSEAWASERQRKLSQQDSRVVRAVGNGALEGVACGSSPSLCCPLWRLLSATALISEHKVWPVFCGLGRVTGPVCVKAWDGACAHVFPVSVLVFPWLPWLPCVRDALWEL